LADGVDLLVEGGEFFFVLGLHGGFQVGAEAGDFFEFGGGEDVPFVVDESSDAFVEEFGVLDVARGEEEHGGDQ
jgi:hypothetical protein